MGFAHENGHYSPGDFQAAEALRKYAISKGIRPTGTATEQREVISAGIRGDAVTESEMRRCIDLYTDVPESEKRYLKGIIRYFGDAAYLEQLAEIRKPKPKPRPMQQDMADALAAVRRITGKK